MMVVTLPHHTGRLSRCLRLDNPSLHPSHAHCTHTHTQPNIVDTHQMAFPHLPRGDGTITGYQYQYALKKKVGQKAQDQERQRGVGYGDITHDGSCTGGVTSFTLHK